MNYRFFTFLTLCCLAGMTSLFSVTSTAVFAKYKKKYFVETGTFRGDGVQQALDAGYEEVYSIELSESLYMCAKERFKDRPNVHLIHGDSSKVLWDVISQINGPITFWLDGHYSGGITARGETTTALLQELDAIARHPIKTHTILIDDVRDFGGAGFDFIPMDTAIAKLKGINKKYAIRFEDGYIQNDVLVAVVKSRRRRK